MTSIFVMKPGFVAQPKLISRSLAVQACVNGEWGMTKVEFIQLPDGCIKLQAVDAETLIAKGGHSIISDVDYDLMPYDEEEMAKAALKLCGYGLAESD